MNIGLEIVSSVLNSGKLTPVLDAGFTNDWMSDSSSGAGVIFAGQDRQAFQWILSHWQRHHKVPSIEVFRANFPYESYKTTDKSIDLNELTELAVERVRSFLVADLIGRTLDLHDANEIDKAISLLKNESARLGENIRFRQSKADMIGDPEFDIEELLSRDLERGVPFGLTPVDKEFYGFQPGHLISIMGRQKAGKSTLMLNSALAAWREGYTILFFSVEMDTDILRQKLYCLGANVSPSRMHRGHLREAEKEKVRAFHLELSSRENGEEGRFFLSKKRSYITVDDIKEEIEAVNPHVVYIDGFEFLVDRQTRRSTTDWQSNETVAGELKTLAMDEGITFVVATQVQEKQYHPKFGIEARTITGGTGLLKKSDLVIGVDKTDGINTVNCVLSRYEYFDPVVLEVDWDTMTLNVIEDVEDDARKKLEQEGI